MAYWNRDGNGYTRGGMDVLTAINKLFQGILLFPIFLLAGYIGVIMMKHMIFHGIPSMTSPTREQQEQIHDRNHQIGMEPPVVVEETVNGIEEKVAEYNYQEELNTQLAEALKASRAERYRLQESLGIPPTDSIPPVIPAYGSECTGPTCPPEYNEEEYYYYD